MSPDDWIDGIGTNTNIQHPHLLTAGYLAAMATASSRCGQMVNMIGSPRDRRTEVALRNIPALNAIIGRQNRLVQRLDLGIGKVDGLAMGQVAYERQQRR